MSLNKKTNLTEELNDLRAKFAAQSVWLLVDHVKVEEFKTILGSDYSRVMD